MTSSITSAPTSLRGYVDDSQWAYVLGEVLETVADLYWPTSISTYAQMRRDPQLSAILGAYTLPPRRAPWSMNPAGCRPAVVQLVADDLGLPVAGKDAPGAARTRGVSWSEHLRGALAKLTFGHAAFEMLADTSSGQARLVGLYERLPSTISTIHIDRQGQLLGISQDIRVDATSAPQIRADRLVWHVHDREGGAWQGTSLLRPAFAPWLLKREMQRVLATSNRRFGMGVPTVEWDTSATPTPQQHAQAQLAASAARVGDQAGLALPPGARLVLKGLDGGTPDTLAFLKWLDQQMSRMALAGFLDLGGQGVTGSYALGQSFVDLFLLNLQAIADEVADEVTRQVSARIVGWNFGTDEPVPAVQVADVGSRHEVTAEALNSLLASGALSADPGLESWVRRTWRLPEREGMTLPAPSVRGDTVTAAQRRAQLPAPRPVDAPTRRVRAKNATSGQLALDVVAAGAGADHSDTCEEASLITACRCGCNGTRHGESRAHARLGSRRAEQVENRGGNTRLAAMTDDELAAQFARFAHDEDWPAFAGIDEEMARRERDSDWLDNPSADDHWNVGGEPSDADREIDALLARGYDFVDAYAQVHGQDPGRLRGQERSSGVDRAGGLSTNAAVRRGYDMWVHEQWLRAETEVRGHMLTRQAQADGIQVVDLFSGPTARARRHASEDLQRWWADNARMTFTQYRAQVLGRKTDRRSAELTRLGGNAKDFI